MLDKCLEVCRGVFCCLFFCCWFFKSDLHVLPGVVQPLWGVGEIVPSFPLFFCGGGVGGGH